jgi:hypothetical protein
MIPQPLGALLQQCNDMTGLPCFSLVHMQLLLDCTFPSPSHPTSACEVPSDGVEIGSSLSTPVHPSRHSRHILYREPGTAALQPLKIDRAVSSVSSVVSSTLPATACLRVPTTYHLPETPPRLFCTVVWCALPLPLLTSAVLAFAFSLAYT